MQKYQIVSTSPAATNTYCHLFPKLDDTLVLVLCSDERQRGTNPDAKEPMNPTSFICCFHRVKLRDERMSCCYASCAPCDGRTHGM